MKYKRLPPPPLSNALREVGEASCIIQSRFATAIFIILEDLY